MAKRDLLKQLIKKFPEPAELRDLFDSLHEEPDRSATIIASAIVESVLEKLLIRQLSYHDPNLIGMLFNNQGPLSDFHGKILVAHGFGIISPNMAHELHLLKAIRNAFAHALVKIDFDTTEIKEKMSEFTMLNVMDSFHNEEADTSIPKAPRNKRGYILMGRLICILMDAAHQRAGGGHLIDKFNDLFSASRDKSEPPPHAHSGD